LWVGSAGTSKLFNAHNGNDRTVLGTNVVVHSLTLPAGSYAVNASLTVENRDEDRDRLINCAIPGDDAGGSRWLPDADAPGHIFGMTIPFTSWVTYGEGGGTLNIACTTDLERTIWVTDSSINAIKVDSIN
jgi:hypothetical protein